MKLNNLNLGKALSKDEQKQIKGGYDLCNVGQIVNCNCAAGCTTVTVQETSYQACQAFCGQPPVPGYPGCYSICYI